MRAIPVLALPLLATALIAGLVASASAEPASPWVGDKGAKLRLVDAGKGPAPGERLAAIAIRIDPGWKTYWRQPGANGVPPRFDFSGSTNVASVAVAFPAPERAADEDGVTNVYHNAVTLPVTVRPRDPGQPVELKLVADYGVCEQICVPAHSESALELAPGGGAAGPAADDARDAAAKTPKPAPLGAKGELAIGSVTRSKAPEGVALDIAVSAPAAGGPLALFAETGDGDYAPAPELVDGPKDGRARFRMSFDEPDLPASGVRLTLAAGGKAIETPVALDEIRRTP